MSAPEFVGEERIRLVETLLGRFREVRRGGGSRLCLLASPTGWGKTRVVQEVYGQLARMHAYDYWPAILGQGDGSWLESRKRIFPPPFEAPAGVPIPFLWLGLSCDRDQMGQELAALQYAERQFEAHVGPLAELLASKGDRWKSRLGAVGAVAGLFGLPDPVNLALTWHGVATAGWDVLTGEWRALRQRRAGFESRSVDTYGHEGQSEAAKELAANLSRISGDDLPIVIVVDDAHWADPGTVAFVDRLLASSGRVLVLATGWPDRLALQVDEAGSFGAALGAWMGKGCADRFDLDQLPTEAVESLILARAPRTGASVVRALVERADGNPNHLQGLLSLRLVQRSLEGGAFQLSPPDLEGLPAGDREIYQRIWRELPDPVRDVLALSTVQGRQFNPDWIPIAGELLRLTDVERGLGESRSPWGWIRSVDRALDAFVESGLFETARDECRTAYRPQELEAARGALVRWVGEVRNRPEWPDLSAQARQAALEAHVGAAEDGLAPIDAAALMVLRELAELLWELRAYRASAGALEKLEAWTAVDPAWTDQNIWARYNRATVLSAVGDSEGAVACARALLQDLLDSTDAPDPNVPNVRAALGRFLGEAGRTEEALSQFDEAIRGHRGGDGVDDSPVRRARRSRAKALLDLGRLHEGIEELRALLTEIPDPGGADAPESRTIRALLAEGLAETGRWAESIDEYRALVGERTGAFGPDDPSTLFTRSDLARNLLGAGRFDEALAELRDVVPRLEGVLGADDPPVLACRNDLAACLREAGRLEEAIAEDTRLLADRTRVFGPDHHATLRTRNNLASALGAAGEYARSIEELESLLADRTRLSGSDHPLTLTVRGNLASALAEAGRLDEAAVQMELLLDDRSRVLGSDHPLTILARENLSVTYSWLGRLEESAALLERALADSDRVLGPSHPDTLKLRMYRAIHRYGSGEVTESLEELEGILADAIEAVGPDHPTTRNIRSERDLVRQGLMKGGGTA